MKAAVLREFGKPLVIEDIQIDAPKAGEVKIKLSACAICHSDIIAMSGAWGGSLPTVYGHEAAGVVTEVGAGVTKVQAGDPVVVTLLRSCGTCFYCAQGQPHICEGDFPLYHETRLHDAAGNAVNQGIKVAGFAEYAVVEQSQIVKISDNVPMESASLLACGVITGLGAVVNTADIKPNSSVAVIGCGGVGLNSIQGAHLAGAQPLIGIDLLDNKLAAAKEFGATHTINPSTADVVEGVKALTSGRGADYVFVAVGSTKAMEQGLQLIRPGGSLVLVGMTASGQTMSFEPVNFSFYSQHIMGSNMGSTRLNIDIPKLVELYEEGRLKLDELITKRYKLEDINEAIEAVENGEALRNVIVFD